MSDDRVTTTIEAGVADVRLNRPEKLNALDRGMFEALVEAGESLKGNPDVRAVVLSGEGRSFCSGLDFSSFQAMASDDTPRSGNPVGDLQGRITHLGQQAAWVWQELEVPVIGAIRGHALGGGFQIAMGPDMRIVHPDAQLSVLEIRWGLIPDMSASVTVGNLIGLERMKELYFTGRMVSGREAVEIGLALRASEDPHTDAMELAAEIASKNPDAITRMKDLVNGVPQRTPAENFELERRYISELIGSPNQVEAVTAFFEKRAPEFR